MTALTTPIPIVPGTDVTFQVLRLAGTQVLTVSGTPTGGTLNATYRGATATIPYNATAAQIKAALEKLAYIGINNVNVTGGPLPGTAITITPTGTLLASVFTASPIIADPNNLTPPGAGAAIAVPVKDITGLTYHLESRYNPGSVTPDIDITSAGTAQGSITNGTTTGIITVAVLKTATAALNFGLPPAPPALPLSHFVLVEINGAVLTPIVTGDFALYPPTFI